MSYSTIGQRLPNFLAAPLFGDRARWGLKINYSDAMWREWEQTYLRFYTATQKATVGDRVNHTGYLLMGGVELA